MALQILCLDNVSSSLVFSLCRKITDFNFHNGDLKTPKIDFVGNFDMENSLEGVYTINCSVILHFAFGS